MKAVACRTAKINTTFVVSVHAPYHVYQMGFYLLLGNQLV